MRRNFIFQTELNCLRLPLGHWLPRWSLPSRYSPVALHLCCRNCLDCSGKIIKSNWPFCPSLLFGNDPNCVDCALDWPPLPFFFYLNWMTMDDAVGYPSLAISQQKPHQVAPKQGQGSIGARKGIINDRVPRQRKVCIDWILSPSSNTIEEKGYTAGVRSSGERDP